MYIPIIISDIKGIGVVVNYDLPKEIDEYVHRIGRTGRLGNRGLSISFYDEEADACLTKDLVKVLSEVKAKNTLADGVLITVCML